MYSIDDVKKSLRCTLNSLIELLDYHTYAILGVFISGEVNYTSKENFREYPIQVLYIPSLKELTTRKSFSIKTMTNKKLHFISIQELFNSLLYKIDNLTEILYTPYFIINPQYEEIFNKILLKWRYFVSYFHQKTRIQNILDQSKEKLNKIPKDKNNLANALFLYYIAYGLNLGNEYIKFFDFKQNYPFQFQSLQDLLEDNITQAQMADIYEILEYEINHFEINAEEIEPAEEEIDELQKTFVTLFDAPRGKKDNKIFYISLSNMEEKAAAAIQERIDTEGYVSLSALIEETGISRPTFKNVLQKMEKFKVAEVKPAGVKGTYIKFLN